MTTSLIPITSSCTLDQQSPITSPWTLRSIRGSERQLQHSLAPHLMCGQTSSWQWRQRWVCTMPAFLAPSCITWQRDMDHIHVCQTAKGAQLLPPKKHLLHIGHILQDKVTNVEVLSCAGLPTIHTLLRQCQVHWLSHVHHMEDGHIPKDIL